MSCIKISCEDKNKLSFYNGNYSLNSGTVYKNTVDVVIDGVSYPPGTFNFVVPPNPTNVTIVDTGGGGGGDTVFPPGEPPGGGASGGPSTNNSTPSYPNELQSVGCLSGGEMSLVSDPPFYPTGLSYDSGTGTVHVAAGLFSSPTQAQANSLAYAYGSAFVGEQLALGNFSCCANQASELYFTLNSSLSSYTASYASAGTPGGTATMSSSNCTVNSTTYNPGGPSGYVDMLVVFDAIVCPISNTTVTIGGFDISEMSSQAGWNVGGYYGFVQMFTYPGMVSVGPSLTGGQKYLMRIRLHGEWVQGGTGAHHDHAVFTITFT